MPSLLCIKMHVCILHKAIIPYYTVEVNGVTNQSVRVCVCVYVASWVKLTESELLRSDD